MDWEKATTELQKKLSPDVVKPAKSFGPKGDYIEGWHAMAEANRIFGFGEWSYTVPNCQCVSERPREIGREKKPGFGVTYTAVVRVSVGDVIREDVGAGHGYDLDCGLAHESAIKEAITDALKRALRSFGNPFGLALYDKSRENVGNDVPLFNAEAAATRIISAISKRASIEDLSEFYQHEKPVIADIRAASGDLYQSVVNAFNEKKAELTPSKEAA